MVSTEYGHWTHIRRAGSLYHRYFMYIYGLYLQVNVFDGCRLAASMYSTIKQLSKVLTAYD